MSSSATVGQGEAVLVFGGDRRCYPDSGYKGTAVSADPENVAISFEGTAGVVLFSRSTGHDVKPASHADFTFRTAKKTT